MGCDRCLDSIQTEAAAAELMARARLLNPDMFAEEAGCVEAEVEDSDGRHTRLVLEEHSDGNVTIDEVRTNLRPHPTVPPSGSPNVAGRTRRGACAVLGSGGVHEAPRVQVRFSDPEECMKPPEGFEGERTFFTFGFDPPPPPPEDPIGDGDLPPVARWWDRCNAHYI
jgi:hypothetical protein